MPDDNGHKYLHEICQYWDSYIAEVENNLENSPDPDAWKKYLKDPTPTMLDILMDFGTSDLDDPEDEFKCAILRHTYNWLRHVPDEELIKVWGHVPSQHESYREFIVCSCHDNIVARKSILPD